MIINTETAITVEGNDVSIRSPYDGGVEEHHLTLDEFELLYYLMEAKLGFGSTTRSSRWLNITSESEIEKQEDGSFTLFKTVKGKHTEFWLSSHNMGILRMLINEYFGDTYDDVPIIANSASRLIRDEEGYCLLTNYFRYTLDSSDAFALYKLLKKEFEGWEHSRHERVSIEFTKCIDTYCADDGYYFIGYDEDQDIVEYHLSEQSAEQLYTELRSLLRIRDDPHQVPVVLNKDSEISQNIDDEFFIRTGDVTYTFTLRNILRLYKLLKKKFEGGLYA